MADVGVQLHAFSLYNLQRKALTSGMGHTGAAAHEPKVTMLNAKCRLRGIKPSQGWAVEQNCLLWSDGAPSSAFGMNLERSSNHQCLTSQMLNQILTAMFQAFPEG